MQLDPTAVSKLALSAVLTFGNELRAWAAAVANVSSGSASTDALSLIRVSVLDEFNVSVLAYAPTELDDPEQVAVVRESLDSTVCANTTRCTVVHVSDASGSDGRRRLLAADATTATFQVTRERLWSRINTTENERTELQQQMQRDAEAEFGSANLTIRSLVLTALQGSAVFGNTTTVLDDVLLSKSTAELQTLLWSRIPSLNGTIVEVALDEPAPLPPPLPPPNRSTQGVSMNDELEQEGLSATNELSTGAIVGIVVGVLAFVIIIVLIFLFLEQRRRRQAKRTVETVTFVTGAHTPSLHGTDFTSMTSHPIEDCVTEELNGRDIAPDTPHSTSEAAAADVKHLYTNKILPATASGVAAGALVHVHATKAVSRSSSSAHPVTAKPVRITSIEKVSSASDEQAFSRTPLRAEQTSERMRRIRQGSTCRRNLSCEFESASPASTPGQKQSDSDEEDSTNTDAEAAEEARTIKRLAIDRSRITVVDTALSSSNAGTSILLDQIPQLARLSAEYHDLPPEPPPSPRSSCSMESISFRDRLVRPVMDRQPSQPAMPSALPSSQPSQPVAPPALPSSEPPPAATMATPSQDCPLAVPPHPLTPSPHQALSLRSDTCDDDDFHLEI